MNIGERKEHLIFNVQQTARWRSGKALKHPDDECNKIAEEELTRIATALEAMPEDHPNLKRLWWAWYSPRVGNDVTHLAEAESRFLRECAFHRHFEGDAAGFLRKLAAALTSACEPANDR